jgi:cell division protein FtsL
MAVAERIGSYAQGNTARSLAEPERQQRPAARPTVRRHPKRSVRGVVFTALGWMTVLALCLVMVHRNVMVLAERGQITEVREQLAQLERQNAELQTQIDSTRSVQQVEAYAKSKGMIRPTSYKAVAGDPTAVAPRTEPAAQGAATAREPRAISFLSALKTALSRFSSSAAPAAAAGR